MQRMCTCVVPKSAKPYVQIKKQLIGWIEHQKKYAFPSFHNLITLAVDFIRTYSKFYTYISQILIAFTPGNEFDFFKIFILHCDKDKN